MTRCMRVGRADGSKRMRGMCYQTVGANRVCMHVCASSTHQLLPWRASMQLRLLLECQRLDPAAGTLASCGRTSGAACC